MVLPVLTAYSLAPVFHSDTFAQALPERALMLPAIGIACERGVVKLPVRCNPDPENVGAVYERLFARLYSQGDGIIDLTSIELSEAFTMLMDLLWSQGRSHAQVGEAAWEEGTAWPSFTRWVICAVVNVVQYEGSPTIASK